MGNTFKDFEEVFLKPFEQSKRAKRYIEEFFTNSLENQVIKKLGIKKGSKDSALVQQYGEGLITQAQLRQASPKNWKNIIEADKWFRASFIGIFLAFPFY